MEIHKDFADWYRAASVTPSSELLEARWAGVLAGAKALNIEQAMELLKLYVASPPPSFTTPQFLDAHFRAADNAFPSRDNIIELRVLAGAILRQVMDADGPLASIAALGAVTGNFGPRTEAPINLDHARAAQEYLARKGASIRNPQSAPSFNLRPISKERLDEILPSAVFGSNQTASLRDPIINSLNEANDRLNAEQARLIASLWEVIQFQREELNMLWWLQTRVSRDTGNPFSKLDEQAALVLPRELAELTMVVPGPAAILGIVLSSMEVANLDTKEVPISSAVNKTPRVWREKLTASIPTNLGRICPVLLAVAKSLETDGEIDWFPVYRKQSDLQIEQGLPSAVLAMQFYTECLLAIAIREAKK